MTRNSPARRLLVFTGLGACVLAFALSWAPVAPGDAVTG